MQSVYVFVCLFVSVCVDKIVHARNCNQQFYTNVFVVLYCIETNVASFSLLFFLVESSLQNSKKINSTKYVYIWLFVSEVYLHRKYRSLPINFMLLFWGLALANLLILMIFCSCCGCCGCCCCCILI